jgi:hypothetical protein
MLVDLFPYPLSLYSDPSKQREKQLLPQRAKQQLRMGSEWVKNVVAAGACQIVTRGVRYQFSASTFVHDPTRRRFSLPVRIVLRIIGANDFMQRAPHSGLIHFASVS